MSGFTPHAASATTTEAPLIRGALITIALLFLTLFLFIPLAAVFYEALRKGVGVYLAAITDPYALAAIRLTLLSAAIAVPLNMPCSSRLSFSIRRARNAR